MTLTWGVVRLLFVDLVVHLVIILLLCLNVPLTSVVRKDRKSVVADTRFCLPFASDMHIVSIVCVNFKWCLSYRHL